MTLTLFVSRGGRVTLPERVSLLLDRRDGGNLCVLPPRGVWERCELNPDELTAFGFLVAATSYAMLETLPQLNGGCINYWEAGNWALNHAAEPRGAKNPRQHRNMHLHLIGRSPAGSRWGEAPLFPNYAERHGWAATFERLTPLECGAIVAKLQSRLESFYRVAPADLSPWSLCAKCAYPTPSECQVDQRCAECRR